MSVFIIRADYGRYTATFKEKGVAAIGWFEGYSTMPTNKQEIEEMYNQVYPNQTKMQKAVNIGQINRFMFELKIGDVLLCPYDNDILLIGEVLSDVYYDSSNGLPWSYCRKINWMMEISRSTYSVPLQNTLRSMQTVFKIKQESEVLKSMGRTVDDTPIVYSDLLYKDEDVLVNGTPDRKYTTQVRFNRETVAELDLEKRQMPIYQRTDEIHEKTGKFEFKLAY